jgi:DNA repair photolyase
MSTEIGITERGDASLNLAWVSWVKEGKPAILITKAPSKLIPVIKDLGLVGINIIVHCTITGFGGTVVEPGVAKPDVELEAYDNLINLIGLRRVVLRIDPIMPTQEGIASALAVYKRCLGVCRISFMDMYPHVRNRLKTIHYEPFWSGIHAPLHVRKEVAAKFPGAEICGEPDLPCSGCVSAQDCEILRITTTNTRANQRNACNCLAVKHELLSNKGQCTHKCIYCYWKG